ncbi:sialidase family protein [Mucilaginibacter limnophilus]|nr:sialidase family protein [Mucilaginibacter limnophilus]
MKKLFILLVIGYSASAYAQFKPVDSIKWDKQILVNNIPPFTDAGKVPEAGGTSGRFHGRYGSQYARLLQIKNGSWLAGYTVSRNNGYKNDPKGGLELEIAVSTDNCRTWKAISTITDHGRDLDNAQLIELADGSILLACRSVRWQESYVLPVYKSTDKGKSWKRISVIDETHGKPGELGKPDKGIYEPHMYFLNDGRLSVMYANEKHVVETPSYSQIISQKISPDLGNTWGKEIWVVYETGHNASRPGMPVWTKMNNGKYIVVYEICGPESCNIYYKTSDDGYNWPVGLGTNIPDQLGGPYILSLKSGALVVTSNKSQVSISNDYGVTWKTVDPAWPKTLWPAIYEITVNEVGVVNSAQRPEGGNNIQIRLGKAE